ncbi:sugar phosphate isomerase/epimerase family protein [Pedobacter endophyticus]|uniref:Sugar phosphate isomerase/epimerase n=1 Tax=Pedobacter endophyticus TaxID=2789740 RepID=A0A7S9L239_9SPHI|nr:sugar phosphate isomerase/epimerase family protein [Pedobacter endophyticus]QPH41080.1 sugar phosphate isomerase/epimerase [Pedobacter endophyticus]
MKKYYPVLLLAVLVTFSFTADQKTVPRLGIVAGLGQDSIAYASGFGMIGESVRRILAPDVTDDAFKQHLQAIKNAKCKVITCNLFFPADIKIAGPDVDEARALRYAETVLSRAQKAGVKMIVLGSGGSRNIPAGYDREKASADFVLLGKKLAQIAAKHKVTIVLENLERTETNFITSLKEAAAIVKAINHPGLKLNADIFHMMRQQEPPSDIVDAGNLVVLSELAEVEKRTLPGVMGDDFKPYLYALKKINYKGFIFIEASTKNPAVEIPIAFSSLTKQLAEVYADDK